MHLAPRTRSDGWPRSAPSASHRVIAELDRRGEIDGHAALCLRINLENALADAVHAIVVDLRDLTAIDARGLTIFVRAQAACRAAGVHLEVLLSGRASHVAIANAFAAAGLGDQLDFTSEPPGPAAMASASSRRLRALDATRSPSR